MALKSRLFKRGTEDVPLPGKERRERLDKENATQAGVKDEGGEKAGGEHFKNK